VRLKLRMPCFPSARPFPSLSFLLRVNVDLYSVRELGYRDSRPGTMDLRRRSSSASRAELKAKGVRNLFGRASERASSNCPAVQLRRHRDGAFPLSLKDFRAHLQLSGDRH
jgi:hypothetical protein